MNQCVCTYAKALHLERSQYLSTDAWRFIKELTEQKQATLMFFFFFLSSRLKFQSLQSDLCYSLQRGDHTGTHLQFAAL